MPLDPALTPVLETMAATGRRLEEMTVAEARQMMALLTAADGPPEDVADVADGTLAGPAGPIPVRIYRPAAAPAAGAACLVWYHGGGWVIGDLESADPTARKLANRSGAVVVSVDYRLAPEHPYPAAVDDCVAALDAVRREAAGLGVDSARLAVGGDSAGGNLAAVVAIDARDRGVALRHQLLVYPVCDATLSQPSVEENGEGYLLTKGAMAWFVGHYLGAGDPTDWRVSPLFAADVAGVAPATVITAEYDPLRDEGRAYAERLAAAGVEVAHRCFAGQIHGFFGLGAVTPAAGEAVAFAGERLRAALAGG
jgi:acetyl esterase